MSLQIRKGEMIGFAGLLGSGRTETAEMIFCVARPTKGSLEMNGEPLKARNPLDSINHKMAFCPEDRKRDGKKAGELGGEFGTDTQSEILKIIAGEGASA